MWKKLKEVRIELSIDGHGELNEYLRPGHDWHTIEDNIQRFRKLDVTLSNSAVIHNLNIMHIVDFYKWLNETFGEENLGLNILTLPEHMSIASMTPELKKQASEKLEELVSIWPFLQSFSDWAHEIMNRDGEEQTWKDMSKKHRKLDQYFDQNFFQHNK